MKKSKFTEAQIAFILRQAEEGMPVRRSGGRQGSAMQPSITEARSTLALCLLR